MSTPIHYDFTTTDRVYTVIAVDASRRLALVTSTNGAQQWMPFVGSGTGLAGEGEFSLAPSGKMWKAIVNSNQSQPVIMGFMDVGSIFTGDDQLDKTMESQGRLFDPHDTLLETKTSNNFNSYNIPTNKVNKNFRGNRFSDLIAGDWGFRGLEGNYVGVLRGGVNVMSASPVNKILQFAEDDLLRFISRNFEQFTDFGINKVTNEEGKTRWVLKGNSGRDLSTGDTRKELYEFEMEIGACQNIKKDSFILTIVYKPQGGGALFQLGLDTKGGLFINSPKDVMSVSKEDIGLTAGNKLGMFAGKEALVKVGSTSIKTTAGSIEAGGAGAMKALVTDDLISKMQSLASSTAEVSARVAVLDPTATGAAGAITALAAELLSPIGFRTSILKGN